MNKKRLGKNLVAVGLTTMLVTTGLAVSAQGETVTKSEATSRFLNGSLGGQDLSSIVSLAGTTASNPGNPGPNTNPLKLSVLQAITIGQPINLPLAEALSPSQGSLGVANHYAAAPSRTEAVAASGAVRDSGGVLTTDSTAFPSNASVSLAGGPLDAIDGLTGAKLNIGALAGSSRVKDGTVTRDYQIGSLTIGLNLEVLKNLLAGLGVEIGEIEDQDIVLTPTQLCTALGNTINVSKEGLIGDLVSPAQDLLDAINGQSSDTFNLCTATGIALDDPALANAFEIKIGGFGAILTGLSTLTANGVTIDLTKGTVTIDLAALVKAATGLDINDQPPNTDLIDAIASKLGSTITTLLKNLSDQVLAKVGDLTLTATVGGTKVVDQQKLSDLTGNATLTSALEGVIDDLTTALTGVLADLDGPLKALTDALADVLKITVNNQTSSTTSHVTTTGQGLDPTTNAVVGRYYQESALRVDVLGGQLAGLELAAAEAGLQPDEITPPPTQTPPPTTTGTDDGGTTTTLPNTGAPNVLPFFVLGLVLIAAGASTIITERRREAALAALA